MTYTWKILDLESLKSSGLVTKVSYQCDAHKNSLYTRRIGEIILTGSIDDEGYIEYDNLTQDNVLGWLDSKIDKSAIETSLSESIALDEIEISSSIQTKIGVPWGK